MQVWGVEQILALNPAVFLSPCLQVMVEHYFSSSNQASSREFWMLSSRLTSLEQYSPATVLPFFNVIMNRFPSHHIKVNAMTFSAGSILGAELLGGLQPLLRLLFLACSGGPMLHPDEKSPQKIPAGLKIRFWRAFWKCTASCSELSSPFFRCPHGLGRCLTHLHSPIAQHSIF